MRSGRHRSFQTVEKVTKVTSSPKHPSCAHVLAALPPTRTLAGIEVFFAPGDPGQKTDLKSPLRGQNRFFQQTVRSGRHRSFCLIPQAFSLFRIRLSEFRRTASGFLVRLFSYVRSFQSAFKQEYPGNDKHCGDGEKQYLYRKERYAHQRRKECRDRQYHSQPAVLLAPAWSSHAVTPSFLCLILFLSAGNGYRFAINMRS